MTLLNSSGNHTTLPPRQDSVRRVMVSLILILFFISGACGLVYEVVWMKVLTTVFGTTALATSTTLAAFMAGLALGSFYFGRLIDRSHHPLRIYALLELGVGLFAFIMPLLLSALNSVYVFMYQEVTSSYIWLSFIRFGLSFIVLLIPATLMGGTLPVITRFLIRRFGSLGSNLGWLYFVNTLGAVLGTFATGFFLIAWLGIKEATYVAGGLNLIIAGAIFVLDRSISHQIPQGAKDAMPSAETEAVTDDSVQLYSPRLARFVLWAFAISGFCSLAYEVLWTRALVFILDNTAHAFTTMLTAFLLGIALGSLAATRFVDRTKHLLVMLGLAELLIGLLALLSIPVFGNLGASFGGASGGLYYATTSQWEWTAVRFGRSLAVMILPTILMGMTFPIASKIYTRSVARVGIAVGQAYSLNTVGGVLGSLAAGFIFIPWIGVYYSVMLVAAVNAVIGIALLLAEPLMRFRNRLKSVCASAVLFLATLAVLLSGSRIIFVSPIEQQLPSQMLYYKEAIGATVKVYQDVFGDKTLSIDGFPVAGTIRRHQDAQKSLGNLPLLLSQVPRPRLNIIGFGAGGSSWAAMQYDTAEVDCVELVPAVIEAARLFPQVNHGVMDDPGLNLITGDGRNYLLLTDRKYDIISVDATSPKSAGSGSLYTQEFYASCKTRLSQNGLVVQWLPYHLLSEDEIKMTARTFMSVFPHASLWFSFQRYYYILVGTQAELSLDYRLIEEKMAAPNIKAELAPLNISDALDVLSSFIMGEEDLADYVAGTRLNTDDHPYLEFKPSMAYFLTEDYARQNLSNISRLRRSVLSYLSNLGDNESEVALVQARLQERFEATPVAHFWPDYVK